MQPATCNSTCMRGILCHVHATCNVRVRVQYYIIYANVRAHARDMRAEYSVTCTTIDGEMEYGKWNMETGKLK